MSCFELRNHKSKTEVDKLKKMFQGHQTQETDHKNGEKILLYGYILYNII